MRQIVSIALLVVGVGLVLCEWEGAAATPSVDAQHWRWVRTNDGWELPATWQVSVVPPPRLHPAVVAAGQGLVSVFALVAFPTGGRVGRSE